MLGKFLRLAGNWGLKKRKHGRIFYWRIFIPASGQPGAPSIWGGKTAEAGAARGESVEFPRPGVEQDRGFKRVISCKSARYWSGGAAWPPHGIGIPWMSMCVAAWGPAVGAVPGSFSSVRPSVRASVRPSVRLTCTRYNNKIWPAGMNPGTMPRQNHEIWTAGNWFRDDD